MTGLSLQTQKFLMLCGSYANLCEDIVVNNDVSCFLAAPIHNQDYV